jgi:formylglycine-generating enzyme required for sulfatase activity
LAACEHGAPPAVVAVSAPASSPCDGQQVFVPAARFIMGAPSHDNWLSHDTRAKVSVDAFCVDRTEVTVEAYARCVAAKRCRAPGATVSESNGYCNWGDDRRSQFPINCVDWFMASDYCHFSGGSLPRQAQWELAARGTDGRIYPWGNEPPVEMVRAGEHAHFTPPVGHDPHDVSALGILDLAGSVKEWMDDWEPEGGTHRAHGDEGPAKSVRGGSFESTSLGAFDMAGRDWVEPHLFSHDLGMRCVYRPR